MRLPWLPTKSGSYLVVLWGYIDNQLSQVLGLSAEKQRLHECNEYNGMLDSLLYIGFLFYHCYLFDLFHILCILSL